MAQLWSAFMNGLRAFRETFVTSDLSGLDISSVNLDDFNSADARRMRYAIGWAQYEATNYRKLHTWSNGYLTTYALYKYIRSIYSPAYRLGEFWKSHLLGGALDADASGAGALPIMTKNEAIRLPISLIWKWSNWTIQKDILSLHGTVLGDTIIKIIDAGAGSDKVWLDVIHPATISSLSKDKFGNIKGYVIEEARPHPGTGKSVTYKETAERDGQDVVFKTFLNNAAFDWGNGAFEWSEPYGFVPMVHIQHNNVGLEWGWNEYHPARSKIHEVDDLASLLSDQIRKHVNPKWLFSGVKKGAGDTTISGRTAQSDQAGASSDRREPGREEEPALYAADSAARAQALLAAIDMEGTVLHITEILKELERDYPELKFDAIRASGDISGRALRVARQPTETKVIQRRANYDNGLVRAHQMALSIGGFRGVFPGFNLDSFDQGALDHQIGHRAIFSVDELDQLEEQAAFWSTAKAALDAGYPLELFLVDAGWEQDRIDKFLAFQEEKRQQAAQIQQQMQPQLAPGEMPERNGQDGR